MRILLIIMFSCILGLSSLQAQIKTFDIKYPYDEYRGTGYGKLYQISPTRTLAMAANFNQTVTIFAFSPEGIAEQKWKSSFVLDVESALYRYDKQSNTLVLICVGTDSSITSIGQIHLLLFDSNLVEKSHVLLDSTITGIPTKFDIFPTSFYGIILHDSSMVWMSSAFAKKKGGKQMILRLSKTGEIISHTTIRDTTRFISHIPITQLTDGKILYLSFMSNYHRTPFTSDTAFNFADKPIVDSIDYPRANSVPTSDGGLCLGYYSVYPNTFIYTAIIEKYDKNFQKQWTTYVPGYSLDKEIVIIENKKGGYYVTTGGYDTAEMHKHPQYNDEQCFQDVVLNRIDTAGRLLFSAYYGSEVCLDVAYDMIQLSDGGILIAGAYNFRFYNSHCESLCTGNPEAWLIKVDTLGAPAKRIAVTGVEGNRVDRSEVLLFPNPASGLLTVEYGRTDYYISLEIVDLSGQTLQNILLENSLNRINVDISSLSSGNYYCRLKALSHTTTRPFIIQK